MRFCYRGYTSSEEYSYLKKIYEIPDYFPKVEHMFRVKHGVFSWSVINLSDFPDGRTMVFCDSPLFQLLETAWYLQLCPKANINGQRGIALKLMRYANDSGPEKVLASYRLGVGSPSNSVWFETNQSIFWKGSVFQINTSVLGYLEDFLAGGVDGASVVCEIYVSYFPIASNEVAWEEPEIDDSLPADMSALLANTRTTDVCIKIRGNQMGAHRCILSARSRTLSSRFERGSFAAFSQTSAVQLSCGILNLKCVLSYMYTGSLDYLARNAYFSVGLYEVADELCLFSLRNLLYPVKKSSRSKIYILSVDEVCRAQFNKMNFFSRNTCTIRVCAPKRSGLQISVTIDRIGYLPNFYIRFKLEIGGMIGGFHGETSLSLLDKYRRRVMARFLSQELTSSGSVHTSIFVMTAEEFMSCDVVNDSIFMSVAYKLYQMRHVIDGSFNRNLKTVKSWCWRKELAEDLKTLLNSGNQGDFSLLVEGKELTVHRPMLAARSSYFYSLFYDSNFEGKECELNDVKLRTFRLILNYIYCGTLSHVSNLIPEDFKDLCEASIKYGLSSLLGISDLLRKIITGEVCFVDL